jgi:ribonuclease P protein component
VFGVDVTAFSESKFSRSSRLLDSTDFDRVFRNSRRSADRYFTVLYRSNGLDYPRLGMAIAKKRVRLAVSRNRVKRIVREKFRAARRQLIGMDIVIMAGPKATNASNAELSASLDRHWQLLEKNTRH